MAISFATPPKTRLLSTVARVNARLGISGVDELVATLLAVSSEEIVRLLGYDIVRAEIVDTFEGGDWFHKRIVRWAPVLSLEEVTLEGSSPSLAQFSILDPMASIVSADTGWYAGGTWSLRAWAGWLTPADDFTSDAVVFAATGSTITLTGREWPLLIPGDRIVVGGTVGNDGTMTVVSRAGAVLTVAEALTDEDTTDETPDTVVTFAVSNLPEDIEMAAIMRVFALRTSATSASGDLTSVTLLSTKLSFGSSDSAQQRRVSMESMLASRRRVAM